MYLREIHASKAVQILLGKSVCSALGNLNNSRHFKKKRIIKSSGCQQSKLPLSSRLIVYCLNPHLFIKVRKASFPYQVASLSIVLILICLPSVAKQAFFYPVPFLTIDTTHLLTKFCKARYPSLFSIILSLYLFDIIVVSKFSPFAWYQHHGHGHGHGVFIIYSMAIIIVQFLLHLSVEVSQACYHFTILPVTVTVTVTVTDVLLK
jgi:hypothetical protein